MQPSLNGPHWQPTGGLDDMPEVIAVVRVAPPDWEEFNERAKAWAKAMEDAPEMLFPGEDEEERDGPPHHDPVDGSNDPQPRQTGRTASSNWEVWKNGSTGMYEIDLEYRINIEGFLGQRYWYNRSTKVTKYWWTLSEIRAEQDSIFGEAEDLGFSKIEAIVVTRGQSSIARNMNYRHFAL
jgi:hypothetical protein